MKKYYYPIILIISLMLTAVSCKHLAVGSKTKVQYSQTEKQAFLDTLEKRTFHYFWDKADPNTGLIPDRAPTKTFSSIAATGFGLAADVVGANRGYVTRSQAANRVLKTLKFFWNAPMGSQAADVTGYHGFYYHFLHMSTGKRFKNVELSSIDTTWLLAGILVCRDYFNGSSPVEHQIRSLADSINDRVDWKWFTKSDSLVSMGWHPSSGFLKAEWKGYNEGSFLYVLALGSPTHPLGPVSWKKWTDGYDWASYYGYQAVQFGPLFGHQYSQMFVNYKGIQDAYMKKVGSTYFQNSK
ncbi:MAG TPA: glucoamylase family protein, partial [Balneolales bacterium]|nr:glucoamylase family protein [Balneolales bacterium]